MQQPESTVSHTLPFRAINWFALRMYLTENEARVVHAIGLPGSVWDKGQAELSEVSGVPANTLRRLVPRLIQHGFLADGGKSFGGTKTYVVTEKVAPTIPIRRTPRLGSSIAPSIEEDRIPGATRVERAPNEESPSRSNNSYDGIPDLGDEKKAQWYFEGEGRERPGPGWYRDDLRRRLEFLAAHDSTAAADILAADPFEVWRGEGLLRSLVSNLEFWSPALMTKCEACAKEEFWSPLFSLTCAYCGYPWVDSPWSVRNHQTET